LFFQWLVGKDLEAKFEAAANLIAKGTPTKGSASTDEAWHEALCQGRSRASPSLSLSLFVVLFSENFR